MGKVTTFLWFEDDAEAAAKFYVSLFRRSKITSPRPRGAKGKALSVSFRLDGQDFIALNGGPYYKLTPAISLFVSCRNQKEIDHYWKKLLSGGGKESRCGWLIDRFGLSWQVIPEGLPALISTPGGMKAMLTMAKLDLAALRRAARHGRSSGR